MGSGTLTVGGREIEPFVWRPLLALGCSILLWGLTLPHIDPSRMNDLGLVSVLPPWIYVSVTILIVSFCLALQQPRVPETVLFLHVIALIVVLHATPVIVYGTLRYSWAWKHVGIVDYIQRFHSVDPSISTLQAYHNWPGFFAHSAFLTEVAGLADPLAFAKWTPVLLNLLYLGALLLILKTFTSDRRLIWLSVWFFYLASWVGQDYFSPQGLNYFFYLLIIGVCLKWFGRTTIPPEPADQRGNLWGQLSSWFREIGDVNLVECGVRMEVRLRTSRYVESNSPDAASLRLQRLGLMSIVILVFFVVSSSHQLTPFMATAAIAALVICRCCNSRALPVLMGVIALSWVIFGARAFFIDTIASIIESFGRVSDNLDENLIDLSRVPTGQVVVALMGRGLSAFVWLMALLGGIRLLRQGYLNLPGVILMLVAFAPIAGTAYGGEVIFRIYLFALPFAAFFAAALMYPGPAAGTSSRTTTSTIVLSAILLVGFSFAHYGKDRQYHFTANEVDAARYLYDTAPSGSLLVEGSRSYPTQFRNYEFFTYVPIDREPPEAQLRMLDNPVEVLSRWMSNPKYSGAYLIITRSQKAAVEARGQVPAGFLDNIESALLQSSGFREVYSNSDARIFALADGDGGGP